MSAINKSAVPLSSATETPSKRPVLPRPDATPSEVRRFLVDVLVRHGLQTTRAAETAEKWTIGNGQQLRDYPVSMYCRIFGANEETWVVYANVMPLVYEESAAAWLPGRRVRSELPLTLLI
jgi:hypothetical protein